MAHNGGGGTPPDASKVTVADAVRLTKPAVDVMDPNERNVWHSFSVRSTVQGWVDSPSSNFGLMLKAVDESRKGKGGPLYEAAENLYGGPAGLGETVNTPKLLVTYGAPAVELAAPTVLLLPATGAELSWSAYAGQDVVEYQVHRGRKANFPLSAATLVAPLPSSTRSYPDTTARQDLPDPYATGDQQVFYQVAVRTKPDQDGDRRRWLPGHP